MKLKSADIEEIMEKTDYMTLNLNEIAAYYGVTVPAISYRIKKYLEKDHAAMFVLLPQVAALHKWYEGWLERTRPFRERRGAINRKNTRTILASEIPRGYIY